MGNPKNGFSMRVDISEDVNLLITTALRLLALRGLRTLRVRTRAFGPWLGEKLSRILQI